MNNVAATILQQMGGARAIMIMTGCRQFVYSDNAVQFRFKGSRVANSCRVTLDASDTYTVEFHKIRGASCKEIKALSGVYCDMLKPLFEDTTGLFLSL